MTAKTQTVYLLCALLAFTSLMLAGCSSGLHSGVEVLVLPGSPNGKVSFITHGDFGEIKAGTKARVTSVDTAGGDSEAQGDDVHLLILEGKHKDKVLWLHRENRKPL
jgi:hypothetical protein